MSFWTIWKTGQSPKTLTNLYDLHHQSVTTWSVVDLTVGLRWGSPDPFYLEFACSPRLCGVSPCACFLQQFKNLHGFNINICELIHFV